MFLFKHSWALNHIFNGEYLLFDEVYGVMGQKNSFTHRSGVSRGMRLTTRWKLHQLANETDNCLGFKSEKSLISERLGCIERL